MKKTSLFMIIASLFLMSGCTKLTGKATTPAKEKPPKMMKFQRCITDATTLVQLDKKYETTTRELYVLVNNAKFYASVASDSSANVNATITPFFDYKLNEMCNEISGMLIQEFQRNTFRKNPGSNASRDGA